MIRSHASSRPLKLPPELDRYREVLQRTVQAYVRITTEDSHPFPWESRFGGRPYCPTDWRAPLDRAGRPLRLLAQINFGEMPALPPFPRTGLLQVFLSPYAPNYGMNDSDLTHQEGFRIIYHPQIAKATALQEQEQEPNPEGEEDEGMFPIQGEQRLTFRMGHAPMPTNDYRFLKQLEAGGFPGIDNYESGWEKYDERYACLGHRIGGYALLPMNDPRSQAQYGNHEVLLLQIDSDIDAGIFWADTWQEEGTAQFFIRREDLERCDFSRVLYCWNT